MYKVHPKDIIASLAIIGLIAIHIWSDSSSLDAPIGVIIGYYFAKRLEQ
jgi:hypothetical protein